jgi:hypothetical protein
MASETGYDDKIGFWKTIPHMLPRIQKTHALGRSVPDAFSSKIQRRLASTVPPKPMVEKIFSNAISNLEQICKNCEDALRIITFGPDNVQSLKAFLWWFSSKKPEAWTYSRACLGTPLFSCDAAGFEQLLRVDLEDLVLPASEVLDPVNWTTEVSQGSAGTINVPFEMARTINQFTELAVRMPGGYADFFRALTSNRCRVRRNLTHVANALEDLQTKETEGLDFTIHKLANDGMQYPLSTWTYLQKLRVIEWTVQLGFELDVYLPDELAGMYHYLSLLATTRHSLLELMFLAIEERHTTMSETSDSETSKIRQVKRSLSMLQYLRAEAKGTAALSSALSAIYIALSYLEGVKSSAVDAPFYQPHLNYELRMKSFLEITSPLLPSFEKWYTQLHPFGPYEHKSAFENARSTYLDGVDQYIKVAKNQFSIMKKLGAVAAGFDGLEEIWTKVRLFVSRSPHKTHANCRTLQCSFNHV